MDALVAKNIDTLTRAIKYKEVVSFLYSDSEKYRVEPFVLGIHKANKNHVVRCYCDKPYEAKDNPANWRLFDLDKISELRLIPVRIKDTRAGYTGKDKEMSKILASV